MTSHRLVWSTAEQHSIRELLVQANGPRVSRTLSLEAVRATIDDALASAAGFSWRHGGAIDDARALTTVCLVGVRADSVTVGISVVHAKGVIPSWGWPDLTDWDRASDAANSARVSAWAARRKENRVSLALRAKAGPASSIEALIEQVKAAPADDAPRLVLADALTDRGDPRGEFIALQCARARMAPGDQGALLLREQALLSEHSAKWLGALPAGVECHFERGFVDRIILAQTHSLAQLESLIAREPVRRLCLGEGGLRAATTVRWVETLPELELTSVLSSSAADFGQFFDSRLFTKLTVLDINAGRIGAREARVLGTMMGSAMPKLTGLGLMHCLAPGALEELVSRPWFGALTRLNLNGNQLRREGLACLTGSASRSRLQALLLDENQLHDEGAAALAGAPRFRRVVRLSLARNRIGPIGAERLLDSPFLAGLLELNLENNPIGTRTKEKLAKRFRQ